TPDIAVDPTKFKLRLIFTIINLIMLYYFFRYVYRLLTKLTLSVEDEAQTSS
ncbi:hypothetical protein AAVH_34198, partial [Aphelenchoides avenae]